MIILLQVNSTNQKVDYMYRVYWAGTKSEADKIE